MTHSVWGFGFAKALIFGEYAVMYGAPALIMALSTSLQAQLSVPPSRKMTPFEARLAEILLNSRSIHCDITLKNRDFFDAAGHKLGIGSSAAAVVAVLHAASLMDNRPFSVHEAIQFHRTLQNGVGSGIDVIASAMGGVLLAKNCPDNPEILRIPIQNLPSAALFATRQEAPTCDFISAAHHVEDTRPFKICLEHMAELCQNMASSVISGQKVVFLEQIQALCALLKKFGCIIDKPIIPDFFHELVPIADDCHVAVKPSGAGGGDIFLAMALNASDIDQFAQAVPERFARIPFSIADLRN